MSAKELVQKYGQALIGQMVMTERVGAYPGGPARIIKLLPDPEAPEIVYQVENEGWMDEWGKHDIGVFEHERAFLI